MCECTMHVPVNRVNTDIEAPSHGDDRARIAFSAHTECYIDSSSSQNLFINLHLTVASVILFFIFALPEHNSGECPFPSVLHPPSSGFQVSGAIT